MPRSTQIYYLNGLVIDNLKSTDFTFKNSGDDLDRIAKEMSDNEYVFCVAMLLGSMEDSKKVAREKQDAVIKILTKYNYK